MSEPTKPTLQKRTPLQLIERPPDDAQERQQIGDELWQGTYVLFYETLTPHERTIWDNHPPTVLPHSAHARLLDRFDNFVVNECKNKWGWRLLMSRDMQRLIAHWEQRKPEMLEILGKAMTTRAKIFLGQEAAPLPEDADLFADKAVEELGRLLNLCRDEFATRPLVTCERIAAVMKLTIEARRGEFPKLFAEIGLLEGFITNLPRINPAAADRLEEFDVRAEGLFALFYGTAHRMSAKSMQNRLSELRTQRRGA
jgi:hypothetical protein